MKNILITTYNTPAIIPEILGFINYDTVSFFNVADAENFIENLRNKYSIQDVEELWIIKTGYDKPDIEELFAKEDEVPNIRYWYPSGIKDLDSTDAVEVMKELIYRVVFTAHRYAEGGKIYISLTGGRKTMSSDIQLAASYFGADLLFHILQKVQRNNNPDNFFPVIIDYELSEKDYTKVLSEGEYYLDLNQPWFVYSGAGTSLVAEVNKLRASSENLLTNYTNQLESEIRSNFKKLYFLPPELIAKLKNYKIGVDKIKKEAELVFIKRLPKAELHCHLGGVADPAGIIRIAASNKPEIENYLANYPDFKEWVEEISQKVQKCAVDGTSLEILNEYKDKSIFYDILKEIPSYIKVASLIIRFESFPELFCKFIYGDYHGSNIVGIGIEKYQRFGDFQGSALLQSEASLREVCKIVKEISKEQNITYFEVRCSPEKYTKGGLKSEEVVSLIINELMESDTVFRLILIGSRHAEISELKQHVDLAVKMINDKESNFKKFFAGFDLAGSEDAKTPSELRNEFFPLMKECTNLTIHAGEGAPADSIWEAVYHLNADRVGHGLTLVDSKDLLNRFIERNIAIEMCPTSNYQIVGFMDRLENPEYDKIYPIGEYLKKGLRVTINTDDPGISLTDLSREYLKSACMSRDGLSIWDLLLIIRNGFRSSFLPPDEKSRILKEAEKQIIEIVREESFYA